jgi:bifunctional non-homologous end joining protein LigD
MGSNVRTKRERLALRRREVAHPAQAIDPLPSLPKAVPGFIPPMQAKLVDRLPVGEQWRYELKLDGYRAIAIKTNSGVTLISRSENDLSSDYPELIKAFEDLSVREGVIDGEIVLLDDSGKPSFQALQHLGRTKRERLIYFAFDLLILEGKALLSLPLVERKQRLGTVLANCPPRIRFADFLEGTVDEILAAVHEHNLEGIVAKLANSHYEPDKRSGAWQKFKCGYRQDFVVGGYTRGQGGRSEFGALIVGYYDGGKLRYASKVGTGFTDREIRNFVDGVAQIQQRACPFEAIPESSRSRWGYGLTAEERRTAVWLKPMLVCSVRFTEWTDDGHLRAPVFEGWRSDSQADQVRREISEEPPANDLGGSSTHRTVRQTGK